MNPSLAQESEKLARCWMQHPPDWLRDYLISGVEDPRVNLQSVLSRHFLLRVLCGDRFAQLMEQEYRFAAVMNWLLPLLSGGTEVAEAVLFGLRHGAEDVEGIRIPLWAARIFRSLPATADGIEIPNYLGQLLGAERAADSPQSRAPSPPGAACDPADTFSRVWKHALRMDALASGPSMLSVLEPACGSANDYRFLDGYGIAPLLHYTGFDLCVTNIDNARALFPSVRFEVGNVFQIAAPDTSFELCLVHDLFEHLSLEGFETAIREICRVTRQAICAHFFQMDEIPAHVVRPVEEYYWNLLSMAQTRQLFARFGFRAQVLHIGTFLREMTGCDRTHNPHAYTFLLERMP